MSPAEDRHSAPGEVELIKHELKKVMILVGGGGFHGYKAAGALHALFGIWKSADCMPARFTLTGSSAGSIVTSAVALHGPEILRDPADLKFLMDAFSARPNLQSIYNKDHLEAHIRGCLGDNTTFDMCERPVNQKGHIKPEVELHIVVSDIDHKRPIILNKDNYEGSLYKAVTASCSIPGLFRPSYLRKNSSGKYEFVPESEYKPGSDTFAVVDGSITCDLPLHLAEDDPAVALAISMRISPGNSVLGRGGKAVDYGKDAVRAVVEVQRKIAEQLPKWLRVELMHATRLLGTSIPVAAYRAASTYILGSHTLPTPRIRAMETSGKLLHINPETQQYAPTVGKLSDNQFDTLIQSGRDTAHAVTNAHDLTSKLVAIANHNKQVHSRQLPVGEEILEEARALHASLVELCREK